MSVDCTVFIHALPQHHGMLYKAPRRPSRIESVVAGPTVNINNCKGRANGATLLPRKGDTWT